MKQYKIVFIALIFILGSCTKDSINGLIQLDTNYLKNTISIPNQARPFMEGIFTLKSGNSKFGNNFVGKWKGDNFCFFSEKSAIYIYFETGLNTLDSTILISGIWRSPLIDGTTEQIKGTINKTNTLKILNRNYNSFSIECVFKQANGTEIPFELEWKRDFSAKVKNSTFNILAHRGGGRNADNNPFSENSLKMFAFAEKMGATGLEIDIQLTKDNIPVIYHDPDINIRLTQKSPLVGLISDYTYTFLKNNIKLIDGQEIPTLEESLNTIIDSTNIRTVWLDIKIGGDIFKIIKPILDRSSNRAKTKNRDIKIFCGVPSDEVKQALLQTPNYSEIPTLCELGIDEAKSLNSKAYGPRWTLGTLLDEMIQAKAAGILAFTWTLDAQSAIKEYLKNGEFDGILTNYPSILAYEFYIQE